MKNILIFLREIDASGKKIFGILYKNVCIMYYPYVYAYIIFIWSWFGIQNEILFDYLIFILIWINYKWSGFSLVIVFG